MRCRCYNYNLLDIMNTYAQSYYEQSNRPIVDPVEQRLMDGDVAHRIQVTLVDASKSLLVRHGHLVTGLPRVR